MPRSMRIRLVAGLVTGLVGLAIGSIGPVIAAFVLMPDLDPRKLEGSMDGATSSIASMGQWSTIVGLGGMALFAAGFLYSFAVWADWFVGRRESGIAEAGRR